ncbi:hypothetical protein, partial [Aquitalea pelogenes]|uniref:hypothetical protein n=1 Tax=Aquitalea pelogenes TaxID=1293573 RepID=UPI00137B138A
LCVQGRAHACTAIAPSGTSRTSVSAKLLLANTAADMPLCVQGRAHACTAIAPSGTSRTSVSAKLLLANTA